MPNVNTIRMGDAQIILKDNEVKSSLLPQSNKELNRDVRIEENVVLDGALFGHEIEITGGNVTLHGAVYAQQELHLANDINAPVIFDKAVASSGTIAGFLSSPQVIFGSDLNAKSVRLKNCYVGGSIFASEITLEDCVVLGGVFGTKEISLTRCLVGTFHAPYVSMAQTNYLLYPAAFSVEPIDALPDTKLYNLALADLGALYKGEQEKQYTGMIPMDLENDCQKMVLSDEGQATTTVNSYSVSSRVLAADCVQFDKMENHFLIESGALGTQILKVYSLNDEKGNKFDQRPLTVSNIASFMFDVLKGKVIPRTISGKVSFQELKKQMQ